jgi:hypothetical protein
MPLRTLTSLVLLLAQAPGPTAPAATQTPPAATGAQGSIDRASDLFRARDFVGALESLRSAEIVASAANDPALATIRFNIARCLEELERGPEALTAYETYLALPDEPHRKERAWAAVRALEARHFGALAVACHPASSRVEVGGVTAQPAPCPFEQRRLAPGTYTVTVRALGHRPESRAVLVAPGAPTPADFSLVAETAPESQARFGPWPWVALGAGLAAGGAGAWLTSSAIDSRDAAERRPPGRQRDDEVDAYHSRETGAWVAYGLGLAGIALGVALLTWPQPAAPEASGASALGADATSLTVRF